MLHISTHIGSNQVVRILFQIKSGWKQNHTFTHSKCITVEFWRARILFRFCGVILLLYEKPNLTSNRKRIIVINGDVSFLDNLAFSINTLFIELLKADVFSVSCEIDKVAIRGAIQCLLFKKMNTTDTLADMQQTVGNDASPKGRGEASNPAALLVLNVK